VNDTLLNPPAVVRPVDDLAALAAEINAAHVAGEGATRKGLEHFRQAGEALLRAKAACGGRKFKPWLEANVRFGRTTAYGYMRLAENWSICSTAEHMREAMQLLVEAPALEEWRETWRDSGLEFPPLATVPELVRWMNSGPLFKFDTPPDIPDDVEGYKLLLRVLATPAAGALLRTGKHLPPPPMRRRTGRLRTRHAVEEHNLECLWQITVEMEAGRFLNWCEAVGATFDKRGFTFPEEPDAGKLRAALLAEFEEPGPADRGFVGAMSHDDLVNWMHGFVYSFFDVGA
jgi:hypothetical protein